MHQKSTNSSSTSSPSLLSDEDFPDSTGALHLPTYDSDDDGMDPFADADDDDVDDDDLRGAGSGGMSASRGAWWRHVGKGGSDSDDAGGDEDDEFGEFTVAGSGEKGDGEHGDDNIVLRPLAVNPAKEGNAGASSRGLSGLWPFSTATAAGGAGGQAKGKEGDEMDEDEPIKVKEAKRRMSIEEPDDDDDCAEIMAGTGRFS